MKIIKNEKGYATGVIILLLLIPLVLLMIITIEEYSHDVDNTIETIESEKLKTKTEDFENEIITITQESLHDLTLNTVISKKSLTDSRKQLKELIEDKISEKEKQYEKDQIHIATEIKSVTNSNDPFNIEINYHITTSNTNNNKKINKNEKKLVSITDKDYPVYDPLPILKTGATFKNNQTYFGDKLTNYINLENKEAYFNVITPTIIRKCPYEDYKQHGNNNRIILNCINNHYYHNSLDGMCIFCRLENRTNCNHYGFETFILPSLEYNEAPASIDHVLLNDKNNQYDGNKIIINNQTLIYLDNGHKTKYGL